MRNRPMTKVLAVAAALAVATLAACGDDDDSISAANDDGSPDMASVTLGYYPNSALSLVWFVAQEQAFFEEAGLDVEMIPFKSGPENVAALIGGSSKVGVGGPANAMPPMLEGEPIKVSGPALALNYELVASADVVGDANEGSDEALQSLRGKSIGVPALGGAADVFVRVLLESAGLDPDNDVSFIAVGPAATSVPALVEGQIDALATSGATADLARAQGVELTVVASALNGTAGDLGDHESAVFGIVNAEFADGPLMDRYCEAMSSAVDWLHDPANAEAGADLVAEITGLDLDLATNLYDLEASSWRLQLTEQGWAEDLAWTVDGDANLPYETSVAECA